MISRGEVMGAYYEPFNITVDSVLDRIIKVRNGDNLMGGISSGFKKIDRRTKGLHPGDLIVIGARPAMGQTELVLSIMHHVAICSGVPVAYYTLRDSKEELTGRLIAMDALVDYYQGVRGMPSESEMERIKESAVRISHAPIQIYDRGYYGLKTIRNNCWDYTRNKKIGLVIIDDSFMEMLKETNHKHRGNGLKSIAMEMGVPIIVTLKAPRSIEKRKCHYPLVTCFYKKDADVIFCSDVEILFYRDDYYNNESQKPGILEVIFQFNRYGATGSEELIYQDKYSRVADYEGKYN